MTTRKFRVWDEEYEGDEDGAKVFEAVDDEHAAEQYGERRDSHGDYTIISGTEVTVSVRDIESGELTRYEISAESVPTYYASLIE